ncbi:MAG: hypothetical protein ACLU9S_20520 [Oscillospiraceae bacterium]
MPVWYWRSASVVSEEDLISGLRIVGMKLALFFVVAGGIGAPGSQPLLCLAQNGHSHLQAEGVDEAPVGEDVAPGITIFPAVVDDAQGIQVTGIFIPVAVSGVCSGVIELGAGLLFIFTLALAVWSSRSTGVIDITAFHNGHALKE